MENKPRKPEQVTELNEAQIRKKEQLSFSGHATQPLFPNHSNDDKGEHLP